MTRTGRRAAAADEEEHEIDGEEKRVKERIESPGTGQAKQLPGAEIACQHAGEGGAGNENDDVVRRAELVFQAEDHQRNRPEGGEIQDEEIGRKTGQCLVADRAGQAGAESGRAAFGNSEIRNPGDGGGAAGEDDRSEEKDALQCSGRRLPADCGSDREEEERRGQLVAEAHAAEEAGAPFPGQKGVEQRNQPAMNPVSDSAKQRIAVMRTVTLQAPNHGAEAAAK